MCVTGASELSRAAASRFTPLQGGNSVGWCVDVGMLVTRWGGVPGAVCVATGTRLRAAAWCGGAASRFIPLQGGNSVG